MIQTAATRDRARRRRIFEEAQPRKSSRLAPYASDDSRTRSTNVRPTSSGILAPRQQFAVSAGPSHYATAGRSASTSNSPKVVTGPTTISATFAPDAGKTLTEHRTVLAERGARAQTPYDANTWEELLRGRGLLTRYPHIPEGLRHGFYFAIPPIHTTQAPPNKDTVIEFAIPFNDSITQEIRKGRYLGPFSAETLELLIGPFQSSPFSIMPKPGRPGFFRLLQNFSFPHVPTIIYKNPSINSYINSHDFPSTWSTFDIFSLVLRRLPPGSQAATRDVAEAYRGIPLHPTQWPGAVVRIGPKEFCLDTCASFGLSPGAGVYGSLADAGVDLFRSEGIGPISKWMDDHVFIRILLEYLAEYNRNRQHWAKQIQALGWQHDGGRISYRGHALADGTVEEFDEDCVFPFADKSAHSDRSPEDRRYTYNFDDIDRFSARLCIPWELSKDTAFASVTTYIGFDWDLHNLTVTVGPKKKAKYLLAIEEWFARPTHALQEVQKLYGKLLHTCLVVPPGRAYLTGLEAMLSTGSTSPFVPHFPPKSVREDLRWWEQILSKPVLSRPIPGPVTLRDMGAFSDASSGIGIAIVINGRWRAWRLIPGWQRLDGEKDIGWAEALGFEFMVRSIVESDDASGQFQTYGDNQGVVDGWRNGRSRNNAVNIVFRRIHAILSSTNGHTGIRVSYVPSALNPADDPSRGIYASRALLLPPIALPDGLERFVVDATTPYTAIELQHLRNGNYPESVARVIQRNLSTPGFFD